MCVGVCVNFGHVKVNSGFEYKLNSSVTLNHIHTHTHIHPVCRIGVHPRGPHNMASPMLSAAHRRPFEIEFQQLPGSQLVCLTRSLLCCRSVSARYRCHSNSDFTDTLHTELCVTGPHAAAVRRPYAKQQRRHACHDVDRSALERYIFGYGRCIRACTQSECDCVWVAHAATTSKVPRIASGAVAEFV